MGGAHYKSAIGLSKIREFWAKWAMELGFGQFRQVLWGIAGLSFGPLIALILYIRLIRKAIDEGLPSGDL